MSEGVKRRDEEGIIGITLDRPDKKNALTAAMYRAITAALAEASARDDVACVLLTGEGGAFCAGNDIGDFLKPGGAEAALAFVRAIGGFDKPIVAAVRGLAIGVGTTMLLHCDLVYAAPGTRFSVPFASIGIVPEAASSLLLPTRMGYAKAAEMLLLGQSIDAAQADRDGLITAVVPADDLEAYALAKGRAFGAMPRRALRETRRLMKGDMSAVDARMLEEAAALRVALEGAEAKEAFTAFLEKRLPDFRKPGVA